MIRSIIFDWDGVIVDSAGFQYMFALHLCRYFGSDPSALTPERFQELANKPLPDFYAALNIPFPEKAIEIMTEYNSFGDSNPLKIEPPTSQALQNLRDQKYSLGIASTNTHHVIDLTLHNHDLTDLFASIITVEDVRRLKPDPESLLLCANRLGVPPGECAYVGDTAVDIVAAKAAGMTAIGLTSRFGTRAALEAERPYAIISSIDHIHAILSRV